MYVGKPMLASFTFMGAGGEGVVVTVTVEV